MSRYWAGASWLKPQLLSAGWCLAGMPWCSSSKAAAGATATTRRTTWCWECASTLWASLWRTVLSSTRYVWRLNMYSHICSKLNYNCTGFAMLIWSLLSKLSMKTHLFFDHRSRYFTNYQQLWNLIKKCSQIFLDQMEKIQDTNQAEIIHRVSLHEGTFSVSLVLQK